MDQKSYVAPDGTKNIKRFKELSSIKWRPLSIFFTRSVAFVVDIPLNKIFVTVVSDLVNAQSRLQMKFK